jgi:hypothetical protein
MAATKTPELLFNEQPITVEDAKARLKEIYGDARVNEILDGLASGKYGCASVNNGYIVTKPRI